METSVPFCRLVFGLVLCVYITSAQRQCPQLQPPWNGQVIGSCDRYIGAQCQFQCRSPYKLVGSRVRLCRSDGTWSGRTAACGPNPTENLRGCNNNNCGCTNCGCNNNNNCGDSTCPSIYGPDHGRTEGQCTPGTVNQPCLFGCDPGYALEGNPRITCLANGQWSGLTPYCRRTSGDLCEEVSIPNGDVDCVGDGGLTICSVTCNPGFMLVGSSVLTCSSSGSWNDQFPSCRRGPTDVDVFCPTLVAPEGGRLVGQCVSASSGDTCQLVCISGYRPSDTRVLVCRQDGRWSNSLPSCISGGCQSIQVTHGTTSGTCNPGVVGQSCTVTCEAGHVLRGTATLVCQGNGQWSDNTPTCTAVVTCPALQPPVNGGTSGPCNPGNPGRTCTFYCNDGYRLIGQANIACGADGRWNANPPQCTGIGCPALNPPVNGAFSGPCTQAVVGQSCSFSCMPGHSLTGQSTLYCQTGGFWSAQPPTCTASVACPDLNAPANGGISGVCKQAPVGQSCSFSCQAGYLLDGSPSLFCQAGGRWSATAPTCKGAPPTSCPSLVAPEHGYMLGTCSPGRVGETCVFSCDQNYVLKGQRTLSCQTGGQWNGEHPTCERQEVEEETCPALTPPPNAAFEECDNHVGGRCVVVCESGYLRTGSRVRTCLAGGLWSGYAPTCTRKVGYTTTYTYKVVPLWSLVFG